MQPKIYSYQRISSKKQATGTGIDQQKESKVLQELAEKYQLPVSTEVFQDIGKSAFKGDHLDHAFGAIKERINDGRIAKGSILVISSLDRLSRQTVNVAQELMLSIVNAGVSIYTTIDQKMYNPDDDNLPASLIVSVIYLERAHNESKTKSARTRGNALSIYQSITRGDTGAFDADGHTKAIRSIGKTNWWLDTSSGFVKPHSYYFPIAQEIVQLILKGNSIAQVHRHLEATYTPPATRSKHGQRWSMDMMRRFHKSRVLIGEQTFKVDGTELKIENYAPPVCTEEDLTKMQAIRRKANTTGSGTKRNQYTGLLNGLNILKCKHCGGGMAIVQPSRRDGKQRNMRYVCSTGVNYKDQCKHWSFSHVDIDKWLLERLKLKRWNDQTKQDDRIPALIKDKTETQTKLDALSQSFNTFAEQALPIPETMVLKMHEYETAIKELNHQIDEIKIESSTAFNPIWREMMSLPTSHLLDIDSTDDRLRLKELMPTFIKSIHVHREDGKQRSPVLVEVLYSDDTTDSTKV